MNLEKIESIGNSLLRQIESNSLLSDFSLNSYLEESITSAIYEGANTTRRKAREFMERKKTPKSKDERMLFNNMSAMKLLDTLKSEEISIGTVLRIHEVIGKGALNDDSSNYLGMFRDGPVYVGDNHEGVDCKQIESSLLETINMLNDPPRFLKGILKGILFHYLLGYIHPFFDGNGRTARSMFYLYSKKDGADFVDLLSISSNLKAKGKKYENSFMLAKKYQLDMTYFVLFSLESLNEALTVVQNKINYLLKIPKIKDKFELNSNQLRLLQTRALNKYSPIYIEQYANVIRLSREASRRDLVDLESKGFLERRKEGKKAVFYILSEALKKHIPK